MSRFWSGWVIVLLVINLVLVLFLFVWGQMRQDPRRTRRHEWPCLGARCAA